MPDVAVSPSGGAPNKRAARKAETRQRLLASALRLVEQNGCDTISVEAIAAGADLSRVGFYLHFTGLADLAREVVRPAIRELMAHYSRLDEVPPTVDGLQRWSRSLLELWHANASRIRLGEHVVEIDPEMHGRWALEVDDTAAVLPRYVARWADAGRRELGVLRLSAMLLQHERLCYLTMSTPRPHSDTVLIELLSEQCWVLLCREPGAGEPSFTLSDPDPPGRSRCTSMPNPSHSKAST